MNSLQQSLSLTVLGFAAVTDVRKVKVCSKSTYQYFGEFLSGFDSLARGPLCVAVSFYSES